MEKSTVKIVNDIPKAVMVDKSFNAIFELEATRKKLNELEVKNYKKM
jgi:hypothetical protein